MTPKNPSYVIIDPRTGRHLRPATKSQAAAYKAADASAPVTSKGKPRDIAGVLIGEYTGPGFQDQFNYHGGSDD